LPQTSAIIERCFSEGSLSVSLSFSLSLSLTHTHTQNGDVRPFAADVGIIDPETLHWDAATSQLFVAGAVSGTVAVYKVSADVDGILEAVWDSEAMDMVGDQSASPAVTATSSMVLLATCAMGMLFTI